MASEVYQCQRGIDFSGQLGEGRFSIGLFRVFRVHGSLLHIPSLQQNISMTYATARPCFIFGGGCVAATRRLKGNASEP